jgi:hypothetical protein
MTTYIRAARAIATALILTACAANNSGVKPNAPSAAVMENPACLTQTGSRIAANNTNCSTFGRSYSSDDIDATGEITVAEALRHLDPSITVHH